MYLIKMRSSDSSVLENRIFGQCRQMTNMIIGINRHRGGEALMGVLGLHHG